MQLRSIKISNVLSFGFHDNPEDGEQIRFKDGLNIIIGENGSRKSTALEVINFVLRRVLFKQYSVNHDILKRRSSFSQNERANTVQPINQNNITGFRLEPNWNHSGHPQTVIVEIAIDEIDRENIRRIREYLDTIWDDVGQFSRRQNAAQDGISDIYRIKINIVRNNNSFNIEFLEGQHDFGFEYLSEYNYFRELLIIYNQLYARTPIDGLLDPFAMISSYRNYHAFQPSVSLQGNPAEQQIQSITASEYSKSLNVSDTNEPPIFALVRLQIAARHFALMSEALTPEERRALSNDCDLIRNINKHLRVTGLRCEIDLNDLSTWQYRFAIIDLERGEEITDVNSLSAGQKAILHLIFESFGRGGLNGGIVLIDEPEIHLHYQYQNEFMRTIGSLNNIQRCQYILVTHSESLINSSTIRSVIRFSRDEKGFTEVSTPHLLPSQKHLIKIIDNTRSTHAFFAKKLILVEGDSDAYVIRSLVAMEFGHAQKDIAVIHVGGKSSHARWRDFFEKFGLSVSIIADFDYILDMRYPNIARTKMVTSQSVAQFKNDHPEWLSHISSLKEEGIYILEDGPLEIYTRTPKDLDAVIRFCESDLILRSSDRSDKAIQELKSIINHIVPRQGS